MRLKQGLDLVLEGSFSNRLRRASDYPMVINICKIRGTIYMRDIHIFSVLTNKNHHMRRIILAIAFLIIVFSGFSQEEKEWNYLHQTPLYSTRRQSK